MHIFTKTGSGQTYGKVEEKGGVRRRQRTSRSSWTKLRAPDWRQVCPKPVLANINGCSKMPFFAVIMGQIVAPQPAFHGE
jgi:hypothetical protein